MKIKKLLPALCLLLLFTNILNAQEEIFVVVEDMPMFPGCEEVSMMDRKSCSDKKMLEYVYAHLKYPQIAKDNGVEGTVVVSFVVQRDGTLADIKILRDIGARCGLAAKEMVESMNTNGIVWISGKQRARPVNVRYNLPVKFRLPEEPVDIEMEPQVEEVIEEEIEEEIEEIVEAEIEEDMPEFIDTDIEMEEEIVLLEDSEEQVFKEVEEMPRFPGCENIADVEKRQACADKKMLQYLYSNVNYPQLARQNGVQGTVIVSFIVKPDGSMTNGKIIRDIGANCGNAVMDVYNKMAAETVWVPGKQKGKAVPVEFSLPVQFRLEDEGTEKKSKKGRKKG